MKEYLTFKLIESRTIADKPFYHILAKKDDSYLGIIYWYSYWRQYVSCASEGTIWSKDYHLQIGNFIKRLNAETKI